MANQVNKASGFFGTSHLETTKEIRNIASKNAEDELLRYKGKSPYKNYLNREDVIISIDTFKREYNNLNSSKNTPNFKGKFEEFKIKYPKLSKWRELSRKLEELRESGRAHFREHGEYISENNINNSTNNYRNTINGKINGFNVGAILKKTPQPKKWYNFSRKKTANLNLPKKQNPQQILSVQPVPTATPSKSSWWPFGGGRKTKRKTRHYKPSGGNPYNGMTSKNIEANLKIAQEEYRTLDQRINRDEMIILAVKIQDAKNALNSALEQEHNSLVRETTPRTSSWLPWGRGGRKTHHKKHHMRKGSRKIHRK
jgi:hypothetical protein